MKSFEVASTEMGISEIGKCLGCRTTVYCLASALTAKGRLKQNTETEKYRREIALFGPGIVVGSSLNVLPKAGNR